MHLYVFLCFRLIGVGLEAIGVEEFIEGKFFEGELFVDKKKESYKKLGFKRLGFTDLMGLFSKKSREASNKAKSMNLGGNLTVGDGYQNGGCLVVGAGGNPTMFTYVQKYPSEHPDNSNILEALGIQTA